MTMHIVNILTLSMKDSNISDLDINGGPGTNPLWIVRDSYISVCRDSHGHNSVYWAKRSRVILPGDFNPRKRQAFNQSV